MAILLLPGVSLVTISRNANRKLFLSSGALDGATTKRTVSEKAQIFVYDYMSKTICSFRSHSTHFTVWSLAYLMRYSDPPGSVDYPVYICTPSNLEWLGWRINLATQNIIYFLPRPYALLIRAIPVHHT